MNNKILIAITILLILIGIALLFFNSDFSKKSKLNTTLQNNQTTTKTQKNATQTHTPNLFTQETTVEVTTQGFVPQNTTITKGSKVIWTNKSGNVASVHSDDHPVHLDYPKLNLGQFKEGASVQHTFDTPGTYTYHDHLRPDKKGTITVK